MRGTGTTLKYFPERIRVWTWRAKRVTGRIGGGGKWRRRNDGGKIVCINDEGGDKWQQEKTWCVLMEHRTTHTICITTADFLIRAAGPFLSSYILNCAAARCDSSCAFVFWCIWLKYSKWKWYISTNSTSVFITTYEPIRDTHSLFGWVMSRSIGKMCPSTRTFDSFCWKKQILSNIIVVSGWV